MSRGSTKRPSWEGRFEKLQVLVANKLVDINEIPYKFSLPGDLKFGRWVCNQRLALRKNEARQEPDKKKQNRLAQLRDLGLDPSLKRWSSGVSPYSGHHDAQFRDMVKEAKQLKEATGSFEFNKDSKYSTPKLRDWIYNRRREYKKGTLSPDKIKALDDIGFEWIDPRNAAQKGNDPASSLPSTPPVEEAASEESQVAVSDAQEGGGTKNINSKKTSAESTLLLQEDEVSEENDPAASPAPVCHETVEVQETSPAQKTMAASDSKSFSGDGGYDDNDDDEDFNSPMPDSDDDNYYNRSQGEAKAATEDEGSDAESADPKPPIVSPSPYRRRSRSQMNKFNVSASSATENQQEAHDNSGRPPKMNENDHGHRAAHSKNLWDLTSLVANQNQLAAFMAGQPWEEELSTVDEYDHDQESSRDSSMSEDESIESTSTGVPAHVGLTGLAQYLKHSK